MQPHHLLVAILIGFGATLTIDCWALFLRRALDVPSMSICMLGRWVLHMPTGTFAHPSIASASAKGHECKVGWAAHYLIGATFAAMLVWLAGPDWLAHPRLLPALAFGIATVVVPFLTIQPAFGLGLASSKTPRPANARLKSVSTHTVFGLGLWLWAHILGAGV
jgi:hypothetical protein